MRRLQIYVDEATDEILDAESRREGRSKAALIREAVQIHYGKHPDTDALDEWIGSVDADPADIDSIVYGE